MPTKQLGLSFGPATKNQRPAIESLLAEAGLLKDKPIDINEFSTATFNGEVIGCAARERQDDSYILHSVAVKKGWRRQGIGKLVITECLKDARKGRVQQILLTTMFWNVNFFRKYGFETTSRKRLPLKVQRHILFSAPKYKSTIPMWHHLD
jgi:N-acetylglutamate synthase-like GNAT family acetyltransferase